MVHEDGARSLRVFGGTWIILPNGMRWTESRPQVTLVLTTAEFRVEQRFAWLSWATFGWARMAPPNDPSGRKYLWAVNWDDVSQVLLHDGFLGVRAPERGVCLFNTRSRADARRMHDFFVRAGVPFENAKPGRRFMHAHRA